MNTLLCSYLSAHAAEDTLFVLWGFSSEDAGLPRPSLDALLQQLYRQQLANQQAADALKGKIEERLASL